MPTQCRSKQSRANMISIQGISDVNPGQTDCQSSTPKHQSSAIITSIQRQSEASLVRDHCRYDLNQRPTLTPIDAGSAHTTPIRDNQKPIGSQSEDTSASDRGTSELCGPTEVSPRRTISHALTDTKRKPIQRQSSNSIQIQDQSANPIPILDQSGNPSPIHQFNANPRPSGNPSPIRQS